jgi:hypothetical protein
VGDLNKSIETLQVATQEYPLQVDNFINLGVFYLTNGDLEKSAAANRKALALQPDDAYRPGKRDRGSGSPWMNAAEAKKYIAEAQRIGLNGTSFGRPKLSTMPASLIGTACRKSWRKRLDDPTNSPSPPPGAIAPSPVGPDSAGEDHPSPRGRSGGERPKPRTPRPALCSTPPAQAGWSIDASIRTQAVKQALQLDKGKVTLIDAATTLALCNEEKQATEAALCSRKALPARHSRAGAVGALRPVRGLRSRPGTRSGRSFCWNGFAPTTQLPMHPTCEVSLTCSSRTRAMRSPHFRTRPA